MHINIQQRQLLGQLETTQENFSSSWDQVRGILSFARSENLSRNLPAEPDQEASFRGFLERYGPLFGSSNLFASLRLLRKRNDEIGFTHYEYQQMWTPSGRARRTRVA